MRGIMYNVLVNKPYFRKAGFLNMEEERDFVVFTDDEGNDFELDVIDYFEHEGQEYAILSEIPDDVDEDTEVEVYIMKVEVNGEYEEFLPPDDDKMEALGAIAEKRLEAMDCEHEGCDCGCDHGDGCDCHK